MPNCASTIEDYAISDLVTAQLGRDNWTDQEALACLDIFRNTGLMLGANLTVLGWVEAYRYSYRDRFNADQALKTEHQSAEIFKTGCAILVQKLRADQLN